MNPLVSYLVYLVWATLTCWRKAEISWTKRSDGLAPLKELVAVEIVPFTVKYFLSVLQRNVVQRLLKLQGERTNCCCFFLRW